MQNLDVDISLLTPPCPPARRSIKLIPRIWKLNWFVGIWFLLFFLSPLFAFASTQVTFGPGVFWLLCTLCAVHCTLCSANSWYVKSHQKVVCLKRNKDNLTGCQWQARARFYIFAPLDVDHSHFSLYFELNLLFHISRWTSSVWAKLGPSTSFDFSTNWGGEGHSTSSSWVSVAGKRDR